MTDVNLKPQLVRNFVTQYFEATRSSDAYKWADCFLMQSLMRETPKTALHRFADNAIFEDPVGTPPVNDPQEILEFGKKFMSGFETVGLHEEFVHVVGNEAAARWTRKALTKEGKRVRFEGINVFKFNKEGKIINLRGYWSSDEIVEY